MCGRVRLSSDVSEIKLVFSIPPHRPTPNIAASWNVAPTDPLPVVRYDPKAGERSLDVMRWGLVPFWATGCRDMVPTGRVSPDARCILLLTPVWQCLPVARVCRSQPRRCRLFGGAGFLVEGWPSTSFGGWFAASARLHQLHRWRTERHAAKARSFACVVRGPTS